ncbi:MAG: hypothetical protein KDA91_18665 [Planctomycetaceae bacterium]|nr:hypothetical protein [Planctomycetaceae bacterium]
MMRFPRPPVSRRSSRCGFSLMEIILATAILMGSVIVLARLAGMGRSTAQKAALLSQAHRTCERTINEIVLGQRPLQAVDRAVLETVVPNSQMTTLDDLTRNEALSNDVSQNSEFQVSVPQQRWLHSVVVTPIRNMPELVRVTVTVEPDDSGQFIAQPETNEVESAARKRRNQFTLSRLIRSTSGVNIGNPDMFDFAGSFP